MTDRRTGGRLRRQSLQAIDLKSSELALLGLLALSQPPVDLCLQPPQPWVLIVEQGNRFQGRYCRHKVPPPSAPCEGCGLHEQCVHVVRVDC